MEHDQRYGHDIPFVPHQGHWHETPGYHPHHHSPQPGYYGQAFSPGTGSYESQNAELTPRQDQYHSFTYPPYPSMLAGAHNSYIAYQQPHAVHVVPMTTTGPTAVLETPPYPSKTPIQPTAVQRKMLSDADRKRMCIYHAENPTKKQTEIGEIFGVERSTVSKVLRQKEKYLVSEEDGRKSPIRKPKGKFHELERALANWARKQEKDGIELTDEMIKTRAICFSHVARNGASIREAIEDPQWIKEFKSRNKVGVARSRKNSVMKKESPVPLPTAPMPESKDMGTAMSPPPPVARWSSPSTGDAFASTDSSTVANPPIRTPQSTVYQSQSNNSLSSAYGGTATSSNAYSTINTNINSPVQSPDATNAEPAQSSFFTGLSQPPKFPSSSVLTESPSMQDVQPSNILTSRPELHQWASTYNQLTTSEMNSINGTEISPHHRAQLPHGARLHPQHSNSSLTSRVSPSTEPSRRTSNDDGNPHNSSRAQEYYHNADAMQSESTSLEQTTRSSRNSMSMQTPRSPSQNEAYVALGTVMDYLHNQQPNNFVDSQDLAAIAKLSEKLKFAHQA